MINLKELKQIEGFISSTDELINIDLKVEVDNRLISFESLFIAIVGARFNPLQNLDKVITRECKFVVYEKNQQNDLDTEKFKTELVFIAVDNIEKYIQNLGRKIAEKFKQRGGEIIAISGSNGKTTTKEMLFHLLSSVSNENEVICTQKNNNNHLGVPFTLFQITSDTKFAIVELGSNHPGEIEVLCEILIPQRGVTTNIGDTHLEFFTSRENVFTEEALLRKYCTEKFYINADDELLAQIDDISNGVSFGKKGKDYIFDLENNIWLVNSVQIENDSITGKHNCINMSVAFMMAKDLGLEISKLVSAVKSFTPTANRSQWLTVENTQVFLDAYNANPSSMRASINGFLEQVKKLGGKISECSFIIGDMNELGDNASGYHVDLGHFTKSKGLENILYIGRYKNDFAKGQVSGFKTFDSVSEVLPIKKDILSSSKYIFIKASRSLQLETILDIK